MHRLKRAQFWGRTPDDDHLLQQVLDGTKTAAAELAKNWNVSNGEYDDGGCVPGEIVEVYDGRGRLRCHIRITEVYETTSAPYRNDFGVGNVAPARRIFNVGTAAVGLTRY